jgi:hypothetical protein
MHKGLHEHPAPFPIGASKLAKKTLHQYLAVDPNLTAIALQRGNAIRGPIYEMDTKFCLGWITSGNLFYARRKKYISTQLDMTKPTNHWTQL